jgi:hypothetical protein
MPNMEPAVAATPPKQAVESAPVASAPVSRPAGNGTAPRPAGPTGEGQANEEDWWTE